MFATMIAGKQISILKKYISSGTGTVQLVVSAGPLWSGISLRVVSGGTSNI